MQTNIFNLPTPMIYRCHIHRYYSGLSRVYMRVFKGHEQVPSFYVLFSDVGYFEGAVTWQGADFCIAPQDECIQLMLRVGMIGEAILQFPDAYASITETANLYVVRTTHSPVRLIAGSASLMPDIPADLK